MTERFQIYDEETLDTRIEDRFDCYSDGTPKSYYFGENEDFCDLFKLLNSLADENEKLKQYQVKVSEVLKEETINLLNFQQNTIQSLEEQLDYIQTSISNAIKHQKTEIGQKALKEVIADYNEWMLGHKRR